MRTLRASLLVLVLVLAAVTVRLVAEAPGGTAAPDLPPAAFDVEIEIAPDPDKDGVYRCVAKVTDLVTSRVLSQPSVVFRTGDPTTTRSGIVLAQDPSANSEVEFTIEVSKDGGTARYAVEITRGDRKVLSQKATIRLR